jgi:hypothetical protein
VHELYNKRFVLSSTLFYPGTTLTGADKLTMIEANLSRSRKELKIWHM